MKLAVINFSGNVGKSTIARHLLAPRIPRCQVVAVESINADEAEPMKVKGSQFAELQEYLQTVSNVVVDVGASNVEDLLNLMRRYDGSHADFDGYIVPTVPARKQQQDTAATLAELARIGVPADRVRLVFNQVIDDCPIEQVFSTLLAYCRSSGQVQVRLDARLHMNEVYARVRGKAQSLKEIAADPTDYKRLIAQAGSTAEKIELARQLATQRLARGVLPELDTCFDALDLQALMFQWSEASAQAQPVA